MTRTAAAARPAIAYEPALALAAPVNVANGAAPVPVQDEYAAEAPVPVAEAPHEPVARVADPWPAEQDEKLSIHEVYRQ